MKRIKSLLIFLIFLIFALRAIISLDPDFGWRLRTGFEILENGVPKTDIYSYTMPSFPWVDHAWASDMLISVIYGLGGTIALGILFGFLSVFALSFAVTKKVDNWLFFGGKFKKIKFDIGNFSSPVFILSVAALLTFSGVRVQVVTWFMTSILFKILFHQKLFDKYKTYLPLFFLVWANLHGGFAAGLGAFWLVTLIRFLLRRNVDLKDSFILVTSSLATLVNPYGAEVYREIWSSVSDSSLRFEIIEWRPAFFSFDPALISLSSLSLVFVFYYRKKLEVEKIVLFLVLFFQGIMSVRHMPIFIIFALPLTNALLINFNDEISKDKISLFRFKNLFTAFWLYSVVIFLTQTFLSYRGAFYLSEKNFYPTKAVQYLKATEVKGQIFSDYAWGGYLIWNIPERKVFIDGRMPSWKWGASLPGQSNYVMEEYLNIMRGKEDYKPYFEKYNVAYVLWPSKKSKSFFDALEEKFGDKLGVFYTLLKIDKEDFFLPEKLGSDGWTKVYEDDVSVIYKK